MALVNVPVVAVKGPIGLIASATVYITKRSDGSPATLYTTEAGGTTTPNPATTDAAGRVNAWVEEDSYNALVTPPAGLGLAPWTEPFEASSGSNSGQVLTGTAAPTLASLGGGDTYFQLDGTGDVIAEWVKTSV